MSLSNTVTHVSERVQTVHQRINQHQYLGHPLAPIIALIAVFAIAPPLIGREILLGLMLVFGVFAVAYNLVLGYSGLVSFGHAAFFGTGSYVVIFALDGGLSIIVSFLAVAGISAVLGAVIGLISLRRRGIYFAMITLALAQAVYGFIFYSEFTGGDNGLILETVEPSLIFGLVPLDFTNSFVSYYFILGVSLLVLLILYRIIRSPFGLTLQAIRENEERANHLGYNVQFTLLNSFVISAVFSGIMGGLLMLLINITSPTNAYWLTSGEVLIMVLLGGVHSFTGPLVGSVVFYTLSEVFLTFTDNHLLFMGVTLLIIVLFIPNGAVGSLRDALER
jgi:branched-chain amino acid transport system permease protein